MHYRGGEFVMLGDMAKGKPYNTKHEVVGFVVAVNPESKDGSCGMVVGFHIPEIQSAWGQRARFSMKYVEDYCGTKDFDLVHRNETVSQLVTQPHMARIMCHGKSHLVPKEVPGAWLQATLCPNLNGRILSREREPFDEVIKAGETYVLNDGDNFFDTPVAGF